VRLTKEQLEQILEAVFERTHYDIEVNGPRDYDINGWIAETNKKYLQLDIEEILNSGDLKELFELQRGLQKKIDFNGMSHMQYIRLMFIGIVTEACEALETVEWKPWKQKRQTGIGVEKNESLRKEIIDIWHFLINLTMASGMDAENVLEMFKAKNKINMKRQEEKY